MAKALTELVNHHHRHAFAEHWGEGKTSSSDGQRFRAGGSGEAAGQVNLRYGNEPGVLFYTLISDQNTPFYSRVIAANARDATYVLDWLLYHESDLRIGDIVTWQLPSGVLPLGSSAIRSRGCSVPDDP